MAYWHGDEWRWHTGAESTRLTIAVIEKPDGAPPPAKAHRVPFGFGVRDPQPEAEWFGNPS